MIRQDYTFDSLHRQISFTNPFSQSKLGLIINVSRGIVIYNHASPELTGSVINGNTLALLYDTTLMSNTDTLQILYSGEDSATASSQQTQIASLNATNAKLDSLSSDISNIADVQSQIRTNQQTLIDGQANTLDEMKGRSTIRERIVRNIISKLTFSATGMRVDCGGSSVVASLAASQTLATVTTVSSVTQANAVLGRTSLDGQGIQMSYMAYQQGFRSNIKVS